MRKTFVLVLALIMCLSATAFAQSAGNLNNGGFIEEKDGAVFAATSEGIVRIDENGKNVIVNAAASMLQTDSDRLYYVESEMGDEYGYFEENARTLKSCALDGSDVKTIGESKKVGWQTDYENFTYDTYIGYDGVTVYNGRIYYLANSGASGEYDCNLVYQNENDQLIKEAQLVTYSDGVSLFSSSLDGKDVKEIVKNVGNGACRFAIADDKIYLAESYADMLYAYYYVNFGVYDLSGNLITRYPGLPDDEDRSFYSTKANYYVIPDGCQSDSGKLYVGLQDSEGDFRSSQLTLINDDGTMTPELIQDSMVHSVIIDSTVYYLGSASENTFYDADFDYDATLGIYKKSLGEEGLGQKLASVKDEEVYNAKISVLNGYVYLKTDSGISRVNVDGGELEKIIA